MSQSSITVGVDGSPASDAALVFALQEGVARGLPVVAVTAWWVGPALAEDLAEARERRRVHAGQIQDDAIARAVSGLAVVPPISRTLAHGEPSAVLIDAMRTSSHLIVGSEHRRLVRRVAEGSVGARCVRNSPVPVTVVPWPARTPDLDLDLEVELMTRTTRPLVDIGR